MGIMGSLKKNARQRLMQRRMRSIHGRKLMKYQTQSQTNASRAPPASEPSVALLTAGKSVIALLQMWPTTRCVLRPLAVLHVAPLRVALAVRINAQMHQEGKMPVVRRSSAKLTRTV